MGTAVRMYNPILNQDVSRQDWHLSEPNESCEPSDVKSEMKHSAEVGSRCQQAMSSGEERAE